MSHPAMNVADKFWRHVEKTDSCWLWKARLSSDGYACFTIMKPNGWKPTHASRVAWMLTHGEFPSLHVLHRCDNPQCVRPDHLFLGTDLDNQRDKARKGRHHNQTKTRCKNGHEFTESNTRFHRTPTGKKRVCAKCRQIRRLVI